ncbi:MAG: cysteine--tRNA ligase [Deltaproteobacteria bacterium]|nr:cysteine--tRNA ligase [Deltaproteobacteria bacterium]MBW2176184.1 cysteine--tRNA ligase [Deltaproteobacteria bacterium]
MGNSILDKIGNTPLVEITRINPNPGVTVLAKLEYMNPGGSVKDRAAAYMIAAGEKSGELTHDKTVIEATSGNTGIGLAMVCSVKGYRLLLAMSESASAERQQILRARGAEILLTPGHLGTDGAIEEVYRLVRENPDDYFMTDQFNNEANWQAHYYGTAPEIWEQTEGQVDKIVATLGTSGTLMGISRRMKAYDSAVSIIGVEPFLGHKIQGLKNMKESYHPEIFDKKILDQIVNIEDEPAFEMARQLATEEGIFVGMSSGAAMVAAFAEAAQMTSGTIVVILPDSGERYLSTPLFTVREKVDLKLFNTLSRSKETFEPLVSGKVSMYSCGLTAYARMHLGECRRFVFSDLLSRYLTFRGYDVKHIMNITDLDDKTIAGSEKAGMELAEFTGRHIERFKEDLDYLGVRPADKYPRASEHTDEMVSMVHRLVNRGYAYEKLRSIYFDISRFAEYGRLSGVDLNKIRLGATVDLDEYEKENPRDFTLLKRSRLSELKRGIFVKTDWGNVRPSWHIQCAAMAMKYLGESYDIHTASRELMFPHHENEIAIAGSVTGKPLAKYWVHCDRVLVDGKKMADKGSDLSIDHLMAAGYKGREIRYWLITAHYRKPVHYSLAKLENARRGLKRIDACVDRLQGVNTGESYPELDQLVYDIKQGVVGAMDDDLNTSAAIASIFRQIKKINTLIAARKIDTAGAARVLETFKNIDAVLNIFELGETRHDATVAGLIEEREKARQSRDWARADEIRRELTARGVVVQDKSIQSVAKADREE